MSPARSSPPSLSSFRAGRSPTVPVPAVGPPGTEPIVNLPTQAASIVYASPGSTGPAITYAYPGSLVVCSQENSGDPVFKSISGAGGTVLLYIDVVAFVPPSGTGFYHNLLFNSSACGAAVPQWPPGYEVNISSGLFLTDFRTAADGGGILQGKLACVLEQMVTDCPWIGGFFLDDLGTRSWFPDLDWTAFPDKTKYRNGAIAAAQTARDVADEHGLITMVNGTWNANDGGGYPDSTKHGCSLADGGFVEHHDGQIAFFGPYASSPQWASASKVTRGTSFAFAVMNTGAGQTEFVNDGHYAYVNTQPSANYDYAAPWGTHHVTGLPSHVVR